VGFAVTLLIIIETKVLTISFLLSLDIDFCLKYWDSGFLQEKLMPLLLVLQDEMDRTVESVDI